MAVNIISVKKVDEAQYYLFNLINMHVAGTVTSLTFVNDVYEINHIYVYIIYLHLISYFY